MKMDILVSQVFSIGQSIWGISLHHIPDRVRNASWETRMEAACSVGTKGSNLTLGILGMG